MPLLETLPPEVENSLRTLRSSGGSTHALAHIAVRQNGHTVDAANGHEPEALDGIGAGDKPSSERIIFATDIGAAGTFGHEWLVVEQGELYVFAPNGGSRAEVRHSIPLSRVKEAKAEMYVGNGAIEVQTTDSETIRLVRFSHAVVAEANSVARRITSLAKGEQPKAEAIETAYKHCPKCGRVLREHSDVCQACFNKRATLVRLFHYLLPYKRLAAGGVLIILASTALDLAPPYIGGRIIDSIVSQVRARSHDMGPLEYWVSILIAARLLASCLLYGQRRLNAFLGARVLVDIRLGLFAKFNQLSMAYYEKRTTGSVMARVTNDSDNLWDFLTDGIPWLITTLITLVGTTTILFRMNGQLALYLLAPGPAIYGLNKWFMPRARRKWQSVWLRISKMYSALNSSLNGMRVVKAFAQEPREVERFRQRNMQIFEASYAANAMWAVYFPLLGLLISTGSYIIWLVGGYKVLHGVMTVGTLTAFSGYLMQFYMPFQNFSRVLDWSSRSMTAAERVFEVLDTEADVQEAAKPVPMPRIEGAVEFDDVSFTYDQARRVLENFSLRVEPGEMIGLVGHSGAGKSTIINLLSRFYDVTEGAIRVDGVDVRQIQQSDFRRQFGIVLQEPFLFPGTIRDNIAYAKPAATVEEVMRAAKAANCHEYIMKFPDGYDTQVGERGQRLSGGERQRISIARAILHDPRILILDEATASVDTETEKQIQDAITRLVQNRTTFAIAHRLSTLRHASRLVVMKDGKMAECGTHDELMAMDGVYANLVNIQNEVNRIRAV